MNNTCSKKDGDSGVQITAVLILLLVFYIYDNTVLECLNVYR